MVIQEGLRITRRVILQGSSPSQYTSWYKYGLALHRRRKPRKDADLDINAMLRPEAWVVTRVPASFGREFEFIDERERLQSPALRKAVRSIARKHSHSSASLRRVRPTGFLLPRRREPDPEPTPLVPQSGQQKNGYTKHSAKPKTRKRAAHYPSPSTSTKLLNNEEEYLRQCLPSPPMLLEAGSTDPFHSLPIKMQPYMYGLLEHYISILCWRPNDKIVDELANTHQKWFQTCMNSEMTLKTVLSMSESGLRRNRGLDPWSPLATSLMVDAYALLNKTLNNPKEITDHMIATVINMAAVELASSRNYAKYQSHINGLKEMVKLRGGLANLDDHLRRMLTRIQQLGGNVTTDDGQEWKDGQQPKRKLEMRRLCFRPHSPASSNLLDVLKVLLPLSKEDNSVSRVASQVLKTKLSTISGDSTISILEQTIIVATSIYIDFVIYHMSPKDIKWNSAANRQLVISTMQLRSKRDMVDNGVIYDWISAVNRTTFLVGFTDGDHEKQRDELIEKLEAVVKRLEGLDR